MPIGLASSLFLLCFSCSSETSSPPDSLSTETITTGSHTHTFSAEFIRNVRLLETDRSENWRKARTYFEQASNTVPLSSRSPFLYGRFLAHLLLTLNDLNALNTLILTLVTPPPETTAQTAPHIFASPRRHLVETGDASHVLGQALGQFLVTPAAQGIDLVTQAIEAEDFIFPIRRMTLSIEIPGIQAAAVFEGYHNKVVAHGLKQTLRFFAMAGELIASIRFSPSMLLFPPVDLTPVGDSLLVGPGGAAVASLLNADANLGLLYPEHLDGLKEFFIPWILEGSAFEPYLGGDSPDHYTPDFVIFKNEGTFSMRVAAAQTEGTKLLDMGRPEDFDTVTPEAMENVRRHIESPETVPYVPASDLFKGALSNTTFVLNRVITEILLTSFTQEAGVSQSPTDLLTNFFKFLDAAFRGFTALEPDPTRPFVYVDVHALFTALKDFRYLLPAWRTTPPSFFAEFECGPYKEPGLSSSFFDANGMRCREGESVSDAAHFLDAGAGSYGRGIRRIAGMDVSDSEYAATWADGAPADGRASRFVQLLWQDPSFGGAISVDPSVVNWEDNGVTLPIDKSLPCGVAPERQVLTGPAGVCLFNLIVDLWATGALEDDA